MSGHAVVITCSTRAAAGVYTDRTGPLLVAACRSYGLECADAVVVPDGPAVESALRDAVASGARLVLTTGGTGIAPSDTTPEATRAVVEREVPGIGELLRAAGVAKGVPTAALSRGTAGTVGTTLVVNTPGSVGGVRDAVAVLADVVPHALDQLAGGDHR